MWNLWERKTTDGWLPTVSPCMVRIRSPPRIAPEIRLRSVFYALALACILSLAADKAGPVSGEPSDEQVAKMVAIFCTPDREWPCALILWTAYCESRWDAGATNWEGPYRGLLQIHDGHVADPQSLYDPVVNVEVGYRLWLSRGFVPWPYCGRGF